MNDIELLTQFDIDLDEKEVKEESIKEFPDSVFRNLIYYQTDNIEFNGLDCAYFPDGKKIVQVPFNVLKERTFDRAINVYRYYLTTIKYLNPLVDNNILLSIFLRSYNVSDTEKDFIISCYDVLNNELDQVFLHMKKRHYILNHQKIVNDYLGGRDDNLDSKDYIKIKKIKKSILSKEYRRVQGEKTIEVILGFHKRFPNYSYSDIAKEVIYSKSSPTLKTKEAYVRKILNANGIYLKRKKKFENKIANAIRKFEGEKYTQKQLAEYIGCSLTTLKRYFKK